MNYRGSPESAPLATTPKNVLVVALVKVLLTAPVPSVAVTMIDWFASNAPFTSVLKKNPPSA